MMTIEEKRKKEQELIGRAKKWRERLGGDHFKIQLNLNDPFSDVANVIYENGNWRVLWQDEVTFADEFWTMLIADGFCKSAIPVW